MSTVNHIRVARLNPLIARECEDGHHPTAREPFPFWCRPAAKPIDPYTRRSNVCPTCNTAKALGSGGCLCD